MTTYDVTITIQAEADIQDISDYIIGRYSDPLSAVKVVEAIRKKINSLSFFPERGTRVEIEPWAGNGVWMVKVKRFRIFYEVMKDQQVVAIAHVSYARRSIASVLSP